MKLLRKRTAFFLVAVMIFTTLIPNNVVFAQEIEIEYVAESVAENNNYQVLLEQTEGGNIKYINKEQIVEENSSGYEEGENVILQILPDEGFEVKEVDVILQNDSDVSEDSKESNVLYCINSDSDYGTQASIDSESNEVTFVMPNNDVKVTAEFIPVEEDVPEENAIVSEDMEEDEANVLEEDSDIEEEVLNPEEDEINNDLTTENVGIDIMSIYSAVRASGASISVGLSVGSSCGYGSYSTRYYSDTSNNSFAYCVEPSKKSPASGTYTANAVDIPGLRAILYYGYGGPGFYDPTNGMAGMFSATEISAKRLPYAFTHTYAALAYYGGNWDAMGTSIQQGMADLKGDFIDGYGAYKNLDATVPGGFTAYIFSTGSTQMMTTWRYVPIGKLNLKKLSANPTLTNGNSCYSLENAQFGVFSDSGCTNQVATLTTDASGNSNTVELDANTYYVKELVAPKGFALSSKVEPVTVISGNTVTVSFTDVPQSDPVRVLLGKMDRDTNRNKPQGSASLAGAEFTVKYYSGFYDTDPSAQGQLAVRTWVIRTDEDGFCRLDESFKVSGDEFWYRTNGDTTLPLGTITIQETKAPTGYLVNNEVYVRKITSNGDIEAVNTYNQPSIPEQSIRGGVKICKRDSETKRSVAQGGATLGNAQFSIVTLNDNPVVVDGVEYSKGQIVKTIVTDGTTNIASTGSDTLPFGNYKIYESKAPTGYAMEGTLEREFSITQNGEIVDLTDESHSILNDVIRGGVKIQKRDYETKQASPQGGATLGNAQFNIITLNENSVIVEGKEYSKGQVVKTIATDSTTNIASTGNDTLPYGHYKIVESVAPTGYLKDGAVDREFDIVEDGKIVDLTSTQKSIYNKVIRGDIELSKFGRLSDTSEATEMNPLEGVIFSVTSNTTGDIWYLVTNENGYADSECQNVYSRIITNSDGTISVDENSVVPRNSRGFFPYDTYTIKELNTPRGFMPINDITFHLKSNGYKYQWILEDRNVMSAVRIVKTDAETGNTISLAGVTFKIYDENMNPLTLCISHYPKETYADEFSTDETGTFVLPEKLQVGTYYLEELSAPEGYLLGGIMQFDIEEGRDWTQPVEIYYPNENVKGKIELEKTDSLSGEAVEGAVYGIYAKEDVVTNDGTTRYFAGQKVDTVTTDEEGKAISSELYLGKYMVKELESPDRYKLNEEEYDVELTYEDETTPIVYTSLEVVDDPNTIYIIKKDKETGEPLEGATLQLINADGEIVDEWITDKEAHEITKLPLGTYILHEEVVPDGYNVAEDMEIEIKGGIVTTEIEMEDAPIQTTFEKFDALDDENSLVGATYQLINEEGEIVDEWVTDGKPHEIYAPVAGEYTVHEEIAPVGYDIEEDYTITVVESEKTQEFRMTDNPLRARIDKKSSDTDESLIGATLQLIDSKGNIVDEWVTDGKPHEVYAIPFGTYTLHEKEAPIGYATAEDMEIEIKQIGEIQTFIMVDDPIVIQISKIEGDEKTDLEGATLQLISEDGDIIDEWVTDGKPHEIRNVPVGTHTLHEKEAPSGYAIAEDMEIEVKDSKEIQYFSMTDKKIGSIVASMQKGAGKPQGGIIEQIGKLFSSPKTGDSVPMMFLLILLSMSAGIAGFSVYRNRKRRKAILATESSNREKKRAIKKKKSGIFFLLIVSLVTLNCDTAFAKNKDTDITKKYEYITSDKEEKSGDFEKEIEKDNRTYKLEGVDYEVVKSVPVMETEEVTKSVESDFVMKSEEYIPEDTITEDGITYTLEDCSVLDGSEYTKTYTAHYDYLETDTTIPTNKEIGVTAENGSNVQINGKLSGTERVEDGEWIDASVSITFDHYDTGIFEWQGKTIYLNSEHPLEGYDTELLESVGADTNSYRVVSTVWSGEPYVVDGVVYRDATANVQYFVNYVRATYTGTIDYVKYQSNYKGTREVESTENFTYLMKANATYTMENSLSVAQIVMFTAIGIAILAVLVVLILSVISKRKDKDNDNDKKKNEAVTIITQGGI